MGSTACWHHEQKQVMTTQQIGQPSKSTKHADEDMKGQDTAVLATWDIRSKLRGEEQCGKPCPLCG
jgi:hypothetical protein